MKHEVKAGGVFIINFAVRSEFEAGICLNLRRYTSVPEQIFIRYPHRSFVREDFPCVNHRMTPFCPVQKNIIVVSGKYHCMYLWANLDSSYLLRLDCLGMVFSLKSIPALSCTQRFLTPFRVVYHCLTLISSRDSGAYWFYNKWATIEIAFDCFIVFAPFCRFPSKGEARASRNSGYFKYPSIYHQIPLSISGLLRNCMETYTCTGLNHAKHA